MADSTGITVATLQGRRNPGTDGPDGQTRSGDDAAIYQGSEVAGGTHVVLDGQQAIVRHAPDPGAQSSFPAAQRGRGQRPGK